MSAATLQKTIDKVTQLLTQHSETPHLDAEVLVMACTNITREHIMAYPKQKISLSQEKKLNDFIERRVKGEPIAYILGHKEFWSLDLVVNPNVLIPRPETEHLIEWALEHLPANDPLLVADLGVGSGAIALALASERSRWQIHATDNSTKALFLARRNAIYHQLFNIRYYFGEWCEALPSHHYHAIISNPPYVEHTDPNLGHLTKYEPAAALDGGADGLSAIKTIILQAKNFLLPGGFLIMEHGYNQKDTLIELMEKAGYQQIEDRADLAGLPRFITGSI